MNGKLIVIEGLDGSGKATQSKLLTDYLMQKGIKTAQVSFPNYSSKSSELVKMYLAGEFGTDPSDVNAYAASSFYAVDRFASYKTQWEKPYHDGAVIIADRYTTSNMIHQCSKLGPAEWDSYIDWIKDYEYRLLGIPSPDVIIYLRTDVEQNERLLELRYDGDESKKDIHEKNIEYVKGCQRAAEYCAFHEDWFTVECMKASDDEIIKSIKSIKAIQEEVRAIVERII